MNYESELQKALRLSEQSFKKEQKLREDAKKLHERMEKERKLREQRELERKRKMEMEQKQSIKPTNYNQYNQTMDLMKWQNMFISRGVGSGLQNLGNSCFMNATLQCLAYSPAFAQLLCQLQHSKKCQSNRFCALCEMEDVIPSMLLRNKIYSPRNLFKNLPRINDLLTPGCQEDAHEFITALLDKIEWAYEDQYKLEQNNPNKRKDPNNPIRKLFTGATKTAIQCARCKNKSVTEEPFCCISLEVDDNVGLGEALEIFTQDELMRGTEKYYCDNCKRKCIAHKKLTLSSLPPILILHFKRFCIQFAASHHKQGTAKKLPDHVEFPEILDFKKLLELIYEDDRNKVIEESREYELCGVLVHSGPQLGYGHYYSLIKAPNNKWYRMNDMDVNKVSIKHVLREQGYIVFYRRKTSNNIPQIIQNNNDVDATKVVKPSFVTNDYFANNCPDQDSVFVENNQSLNNINGNDGNDRTQYVQVPPMAVRPELNNNKNKNTAPYQEIFWPPTDIEKTQ